MDRRLSTIAQAVLPAAGRAIVSERGWAFLVVAFGASGGNPAQLIVQTW